MSSINPNREEHFKLMVELHFSLMANLILVMDQEVYQKILLTVPF